jgi:hypothetical protein
MDMSIEFEEPNVGVDRYKVTITATAFVSDNPIGIKLWVYGDNKSGKYVELDVPADPLGKAVYTFFKNKIFKGCKLVKSLATDNRMGTMFAGWRIESTEIENVIRATKNTKGIKWGEAFETEKKK